MNVPQDTRVIHHDDERPDTLAFNSQLFQAVSLQLQVVIRQLLNEEPGSTWKATQGWDVPLRLGGGPTDMSHSLHMHECSPGDYTSGLTGHPGNNLKRRFREPTTKGSHVSDEGPETFSLVIGELHFEECC